MIICTVCHAEDGEGLGEYGICHRHPTIIVNKSGDLVCFSTLTDGIESWTNMGELFKPDPKIGELDVNW